MLNFTVRRKFTRLSSDYVNTTINLVNINIKFCKCWNFNKHIEIKNLGEHSIDFKSQIYFIN